MRRGSLFKRCTKCDARVKDRACPRCGARSYTWGYAVDVSPRGDERKQSIRAGYRTRDEAAAALEGILKGLKEGAYVEPSNTSLPAFLINEWLPAKRTAIRSTTWASYRMNV